MGKNRLEAFSDGVIAILITLMVLELKVPPGTDLQALLPLWLVFISYVLSFVSIGLSWNELQYRCHPSFRALANLPEKIVSVELPVHGNLSLYYD